MGENSAILTTSLCRNCAKAMKFTIKADNMWYVECISLEDTTLPKSECKDYLEE